ncbi:hypothetical protein DRQ11_05315 [candidate division KSB1 bacterium]|nr:MAG: hypothetical protein DRQ11_05315 [candidate division KSB1 bacterium]
MKKHLSNVGMCMMVIMALMIMVGTSKAATMCIETIPDIQPNTEGSLTFNILLNDMGDIDLLDAFNLGIQITPTIPGLQFNAEATEDITPNNPNYVFYENSYEFDAANPGGNPYAIVISDLTISGTGVNPFDDDNGDGIPNNLLATVVLDYPALPFCTTLYIELYDTTWNFVVDPDYQTEFIMTLNGDLDIHVVPIPGTVLLLGSGLIGVISLRRISRKT